VQTPNNETRQRILDAAEELFSKRGYAAVRLRDIAGAVGMRHASLYYYAPKGKQQLFVEVMERNFARHLEGLTAAISGAGDDLRAQMYAVAEWLITQPPLDFGRMQQSDMREIGEEEANRLMEMGYNAMRLPIVAALKRARDTGTVAVSDANLAAMGLVNLVQSVHQLPSYFGQDARLKTSKQLVDMLLDGWLRRS